MKKGNGKTGRVGRPKGASKSVSSASYASNRAEFRRLMVRIGLEEAEASHLRRSAWSVEGDGVTSK